METQEILDLRMRIGRVLKSPACYKICFRLDNIGIGLMMYHYIGEAIQDGTLTIVQGNNQSYQNKTKTLTLEKNASDCAIVHESTHVLINATHAGQSISRGSHEAAAYLAETLYALYSNVDVNIDDHHLFVQVTRLARKVMAFNASKQGGMFICPAADVQYIKVLLDNSALKTEPYVQDVQIGIGYGPQ